MTNKPNGTLYIGVTNDLIRRVYEHKSGAHDGFTKKYCLRMLVYFECFDDVSFAIQREKTMKHWVNEWKVKLIERENPEWKDLYQDLL
jgi:putative endonuclease